MTTSSSFFEAIDFWGRAVRAGNFALDHFWLWPILGFAVWAGLKARSQHELVGKLDERADAAFADVDALLVERNTLLTNLAEVVRSFANHEHEVIRDILDARIDSLHALGSHAMRNDSQIANVIQNLTSVSEKYPELKSADHYSGLRADIIRIEERITAARRFYNLAVEELNGVRRAFPVNLIAGRDSKPEREKFSLGERRTEFAEAVKLSL